MSECKDAPRKELISEINQCHLEQEKYEKELLELQAQVAVLRGALEAIANTTSHKRAVQLAIRFIAATRAEASERVQKLAELLQDAVSETENGERLSKGFCSAAKAALSEWRSDKCSA